MLSRLGLRLGLARLCGVFGRTRQAYYKQTAQTIRIRFQAEIVLELVCDLRRKMPRLGGRKLYFLLKQDFRRLSYTLGRDAFFSLLRDHEFLVRPRKKFVSTTNSAHHYRTYPNLVQDLRVNRPHQMLVADITYIRVGVGFCYLFVITDVYSRMIVGYDLNPSLGVEGGLIALRMSLKLITTSQGTIHHSDRGVQYCCTEYVSVLMQARICISMGAVGNPYDNAIAERVHGILKDEFFLDQTFSCYRIAHSAVREAIETYNTLRPHTSLGYLTPLQAYRDFFRTRRKAA